MGFFQVFFTPDEIRCKARERYPGHSGFLCIPGCSSTFRSHSRRWRCSYIHTAADSHSQTSREDTLYKNTYTNTINQTPRPTPCKTNTHVVIDCLGWWMSNTVTHTDHQSPPPSSGRQNVPFELTFSQPPNTRTHNS